MLSAYADGELDGGAKIAAEHLIEQCPEAGVYLKHLRELNSRIECMPVHAPSEELKQRIDNAIINQRRTVPDNHPEHAEYFFKWGYITTAAAVILATVIGINIYNHVGQKTLPKNMLLSMNMYKNIELYRQMNMIEHLNEVMAVSRQENGKTIR